MNDKNIEPLVSVVIVTYNSAKYVIETLESVKNQSYKNIELVISDDCSKDNTVKICKKWIKENKDRFANTKIVTVEKNTGVSANCNRSIQNASSEWVKFMAGDDLFLPNCIEDNMEYVNQNKDATVLFSYIYNFSDKFNLNNKYERYPINFPKNLMDKSFSALDQYKKLLISDRITYTPSYFFNKKAVLSVGGYDESLKILEDYPMWLKLTKSGIKLHFMEKVTVAYRRHESNLNNNSDYGLFKPQYLKAENIRKKYVYPNLPWDISNKLKFEYHVSLLFAKLNMNKRSNFLAALYKVFTVYFNPFQYVVAFKKHILKFNNSNIFYES